MPGSTKPISQRLTGMACMHLGAFELLCTHSMLATAWYWHGQVRYTTSSSVVSWNGRPGAGADGAERMMSNDEQVQVRKSLTHRTCDLAVESFAVA